MISNKKSPFDFKSHMLFGSERLVDMVSSIECNGILVPVILRKIETDENGCDHKMLAGHNRMNTFSSVRSTCSNLVAY